MIQDIEVTPEYLTGLLQWGQPRVIRRKGRVMHLLQAEPSEDFEWHWKHSRGHLVALGVDRGPGNCVLWWQEAPQDTKNEILKTIAASAALDSDIQVDVPKGLSLRGYQKACVAFYRGKKSMLNGDDMGLGKTIETIAIINDNPTWKKILIVTPPTFKINWYRELKKWLTRPMSVWFVENGAFPARDIVIINYEILHNYPNQLAREWDCIILDEAHKIKNPKTRQSKCVFGLQKWARNRMALTGTPIINNADEIFTLLSWMDPINYDNPVRFQHRYSNPKTLQIELRSSVMIRRLKADVLTELPPKVRRIIELENEDGKFYREEQKAWGEVRERKFNDLAKAIQQAEILKDNRAYRNALSAFDDLFKVSFHEMAEFRHRAGQAKIPMAIEFIRNAIEESGKVIVFAHHRDVLEAIHRAFPSAVILYGGMNVADKQLSVDRFQNDPKCQLFIGGLTVAGEGITLTAADRIVFVELDWRPSMMEQAESRGHRMGQTETVMCDYLVLKNSCDARAAQRLVMKADLSDKILDDQLK